MSDPVDALATPEEDGRCGDLLFEGPGLVGYVCSRWRLHDGPHRNRMATNRGGQTFGVEWFNAESSASAEQKGV